MARVTVEDSLETVDNRFALCLLTVKRARQLMSGARTIVEEGRDKPPVTALREIATGKVRFDRDVKDVLAGKYNPPPVDVQLVPAGTKAQGGPSGTPGGLF